jgi:hypothetical protein
MRPSKGGSSALLKRAPNRISFILAVAIVALGLVWIVFSQYAVPPLIASVYRGESLPALNRMISGQASHPLSEYLAAWFHLRWRLLADFFLLGLFLIGFIRPEFQKALWGSPADYEPSSEMPGQRGASGETRDHLVAFIFYLALAIVFTLPGSLHLGRVLLGDGRDTYMHTWFLWDFAKSVAHGQNPFRTDLILYPFGANLAWATTDPLAGLIALPISLLLGPVLAYNISILLQLTLSAFFARLLCLRISKQPVASTVGGIIFAFSPFLIGHALVGHLSMVTAFPIPLYILVLDRLLEAQKPSWKDGCLLGLAMLLTALANSQYTVICALLTIIILSMDFRVQRWALLKRVWIPLVVSAATFLICFSPILSMMLGHSNGLPNPRPMKDAEQYSSDLLGFFVPSKSHSFVGSYVRKLPADFFANGIEGNVYAGVVALFLGARGFWVARGKQRRWAGMAFVLGILFAILSFGPTLHFLGAPANIRSPAGLLYKIRFARFIEPGRFAVITMLCISLLATFGLAFLLNKLQERWQRSLLVSVVVAGLVLEFISVPFTSTSTVDPARYWMVQKTTHRCSLPPRIRNCTVLTAPMFDKWHYNSAMWMQMMDGGRYRIVDGAISPYISDLSFDQMPIVRSLRQAPTTPLDAGSDRKFAESLVQELNVCAVVVFDASESPSEVNYVRQVFDANENIVGSCAVFELPTEPKKASLNHDPGEPSH